MALKTKPKLKKETFVFDNLYKQTTRNKYLALEKVPLKNKKMISVRTIISHFQLPIQY